MSNDRYPNLAGKVHPDVAKAVIDLYREVMALRGGESPFQAEPDYEKIRRALSAGGSHPLNTTNLLGKLAEGQRTDIPTHTADPPLSHPDAQEGTVIQSGGVNKIFRNGAWTAF